jgi:hypothetical protein
MNPSDFRNGPQRFRLAPFTLQWTVLRRHPCGSPALHCFSSATCRPCYPGKSDATLPLSHGTGNGLPHLTTGSASPNILTRLPVGSLTLRPVASPLGNLQPPITRTLLPGARKVYGQLLSRDFNPQEKQPVTAHGEVSYSQMSLSVN